MEAHFRLWPKRALFGGGGWGGSFIWLCQSAVAGST